MRNTRGFTIIELMVTLAVASLLIFIGVPSFTTFIQNNRITSSTNFVVSQINYARSEAVRLNLPVNIARTGSVTQDLTDGWQIFSDAGSATGNSAYSASDGDVLLRQFEGYDSGGLQIRVNSPGNQWIAFNQTGLLSEGGSSIQIAVCDDRGVSAGRLITVSTTGRTRVTRSTDTTDPLTDCTP